MLALLAGDLAVLAGDAPPRGVVVFLVFGPGLLVAVAIRETLGGDAGPRCSVPREVVSF